MSFFEHQVAGHKDQLRSHPQHPSRLIKQSSKPEIEFYKSLQEPIAWKEALREHMPIFYGAKEDSIEIQNLIYDYNNPSIIDVKLGTILYDSHASADKRARMEQVAKDTTSGSMGIRICGMKVIFYEI